MSIQDFGSIGELIAAIATVATLAYLAIQVRKNTLSTYSSSFHAISDSMNYINMTIAQNPDLSRIWLTGSVDRKSLSDEERYQFDMVMLSCFHVFDTMHYQARKGSGDTDLVTTEERSLTTLFALPGVKEWWNENPYAFGPEFRSYLGKFNGTDA
ncbi:MAG: hypothetical protein ABGY96_27760 [bacterium]